MTEITRIYGVVTRPELRAEFEPLFRTVALSSVSECDGCLSANLGAPSSENPDEYALISTWRSLEALMEFADEDWTKAHIPEGMERFVKECWVHHFTSFS